MALARRLMLALALVVLAAGRAGAQIERTVHNLATKSAKTHGDSKSVGVCIFCHTPHNARPTQGLWNRDLPAVTYKIYQSSTLRAQISQPNGSSRLCLSCHDGIVALSNMRVAPISGPVAPMAALTGQASLGTDLSNDHPISFIYNSALALRAGDLIDPMALPQTAPLDSEKQLQCTSCHDPHLNRPNFLRIDDRFGADCTVCHRDRNWRSSSHATAAQTWRGGRATTPWPTGGYATMAENACQSCHRVHAAPHPQLLLAQTVEEKNCTICHNGMLAKQNIEAEFFKPSSHQVRGRQWIHNAAEDPVSMPRHVTCVDCHNPHAATSSALGTKPPVLPGALRGVSGVTVGGVPIKEANFEYEVCLKCHGMTEPTGLGIVRQDLTRNIGRKINPANMSYHPLAAPDRKVRITGLTTPYNSSSVISCTDCHNNDRWTKGGTAPRGPHGSRFEPILQMEYETMDPSTESYASYALCYKCHDRSTILFNFGGFPHKQHIVDQHISCAVCHDPHGSRQSTHLINFMTMSKQGAPVVRPSKSGRLEYVPDPARPGHGKCYMTCHNTDHNPASY
jgi:predicted CXXCH cytochrome family protein